MPYHAMAYHTVPYRPIPFPDLPDPTSARLALLCLVWPYHLST